MDPNVTGAARRGTSNAGIEVTRRSLRYLQVPAQGRPQGAAPPRKREFCRLLLSFWSGRLPGTRGSSEGLNRAGRYGMRECALEGRDALVSSISEFLKIFRGQYSGAISFG